MVQREEAARDAQHTATVQHDAGLHELSRTTSIEPAVAYTKAVVAFRRAGHPYMGNPAALEDAMTSFYTEGHTADNALAKVFSGMDVPTTRAALVSAETRLQQNLRLGSILNRGAQDTLANGSSLMRAFEGTADGLAIGAFLHWSDSQEGQRRPFYEAGKVEQVLVHGLRAHLAAQDPAFRLAMASAFSPALQEPWATGASKEGLRQRQDEVAVLMDGMSQAETQRVALAATQVLYQSAAQGLLGSATHEQHTMFQQVARQSQIGYTGLDSADNLARLFQEPLPKTGAVAALSATGDLPHPIALIQTRAMVRAMEMGQAHTALTHKSQDGDAR